MIRCIHLTTGADGESHFTEGQIDLPAGERGDSISSVAGARSISFRETSGGGSFDWHDAPEHQLVLTLSGTLEFETRSGARFQLNPGDVLWAEDTAGGGHRWRLLGTDPWRRAYVILSPDARVPFVPTKGNTHAN